jgi:hypothetical protein
MKSCVAAISSSPFLGVTRLDLFCKTQNKVSDGVKLISNAGIMRKFCSTVYCSIKKPILQSFVTMADINTTLDDIHFLRYI